MRGYEAELRVVEYLRSKNYAVWHVENIALQLLGIDIIFQNRDLEQKLVQVKRDDRAMTTKNIFWEVSQHGRLGWGVPDAIKKSSVDWFCWVIGDEMLWLPRAKVLELARIAYKYPLKETRFSTGHLIPTRDAFLR